VSRRLLIILALSLVTFFAGLGHAAIGDSDEAYYAEAGREMVERGDWLTPFFNYKVRFQKPILYYWLVASAYTVAGVSAAAARFWSALAGVGLAWVTFDIGRRLYGPRPATLAGAIIATSFGYFAMARAALPDLPLAFFVTLATWKGIEALDRPLDWKPLLTAAIASALGVLTKGPLGVLLPLLVIVPLAAFERRLRVFSPGRLVAAALVFAAIALPWYAVMTRVHGTAYLEEFLVGDNIERFATTRFNDPRAPWFYVPIVLGGLLPWSPFLALLVAPAWRWIRRRRALTTTERRLVAWTLLPLMFFTISIGKQPRYILPILPPLAVLLAAAIEARIASTAPSRQTGFRASALCTSLVLALIGLGLFRAKPLLAVSTNETVVVVSAAVIGVAALVAALGSLFVPVHATTPIVTIASALALVALHYGLFAPPGADPVERVAAVIEQHSTRGDKIGTYGVLVRNLVFYTGVPTEVISSDDQLRMFLRSRSRVFCVVPGDAATRLQQEGFPRLKRLADIPSFDGATLKPRMFIAPDSERDLQTITVVTNH
jgi:4-amino-4-deoxy-L-arabinose transferase-like glycosyltransferase